MRHVLRKALLSGIVMAAALGRAEATFHFMVIEEVYPGSHLHPDAQYVVLRTTSSGQNLLNTHPIMTWGAAGNLLPNFGTFDHDETNTANGAHYIMATQAAVDLFGFTASQIVTGSLPFPSGRICFAPFLGDFVDCVAYGTFGGNNGPWGTPAISQSGLVRQRAMKRIRIITPHNNSTDYNLGPPRPVDETNTVRDDVDGDGIPDISDCAPGNAAVYLKPLEASNLRVDRMPDGLGGFTTTLAWLDQDLLVGPATVYDLVMQELFGLAAPQPWTTAGCLVPDSPGPTATDGAPEPLVGMVRLYLARATNVCADGTYGNFNPGLAANPPPDPRDPLDVAATTPCP
jgi:hypothetical protein